MRSIQRGTRFILLLLLALWPGSASAQGTIIPFITQFFTDASGNPLASGKLCTYVSGLSTPQATYSDVTLQTLNSNPVILSSNGRPTSGAIFLLPTSYKFVLRTAGTDTTCSTGTILWTLDNISAIPTTAANLDIAGTAGESLNAGDLAYLSDGSGGATTGRWYKADADQTYSSSLATTIGFATAAIASGDSGTFRLAGRQTGLSGLTAGSDYYASATGGALTATAPTNARFVGRADSTTALVVGEPTTASIIARAMRVNAGTPYTLTWPSADAAGALTSNGAGVLSFASSGGKSTVEGRLTLTTGVPVTTADVTAATTLYYALYQGNQIALYTGSAWVLTTFTQLSIAVPATTSTMYDVFIDYTAGSPVLELVAWTNDTTRAVALATQDGVYVQTSDADSRYVGSFRTTGVSGQTEDSLTKRYVWNYYNRVPRALKRFDTTDTWSYTTATWRVANAPAANQVEAVIGVAEVPISVTLYAISNNSTAGVAMYNSIGEDSTSAPSSNAQQALSTAPVANHWTGRTVSLSGFPAVGYHYWTWLEYSQAAGATTWGGDLGSPGQSGLLGWIEG